MYSNFKMDKNDIYHHGILGQKWGVRRFQNKDGSLTAAGRKRIGNKEDNAEYKYNKAGESGWVGAKRALAANKGTAKKVAVGVAATTTVAAAAVLYAKNPAVAKAVNSAMSKVGKTSVKALKAAADGAKEGVKEGVKEAPKKAAKAVIIGIGMNATKRILDSAVGKEEAARIFKANNNKKIDSFWKVSQEDKDDD